MNHPLCRQRVTLYRKTGSAVTRTVVEDCFYTWQDCLTEEDNGRRFQRKCLLIAPCEVLPGDRVTEGVGPVISAQEWAGFIPVNVPTLSEVAYAEAYCFGDKLHHYEAGRK